MDFVGWLKFIFFGKPLVLIHLLLMDYPLEKNVWMLFFHFSLNLF